MRILLYTGKGGVGKTTLAAASAVRAAELGHRTLLMSADMAHSLSDVLDCHIGYEPTLVMPNLWALEIDVLKDLEEHWGELRAWLSALFRWNGLDDVMAEELALLPGMEELAGLLRVTSYDDDDNHYDLLIIDCAASAETTRLLSLPDAVRWYMRKFFRPTRAFLAAARPLVRTVSDLPLPTCATLDEIDRLYSVLTDVRARLSDPSCASIRLIVNAERMVIKEAQRVFSYLCLYGFPVDMVICNRLIENAGKSEFLREWKAIQSTNLKLIMDTFLPIPVYNSPLLPKEAVGIDSLRFLAHDIFGSLDPADRFFSGRSQQLLREGSKRVMILKLPFQEARDVSVIQEPHGGELIVQAGRYRRAMMLPTSLLGSPIERATLADGSLEIVFGQRVE